jgi:hypothetical protein
MNWFRQILGGTNTAAAGVASVHMDTPSGHAGLHSVARQDATLVTALKADHRKLLEVHELIGRLMSQRRYAEIPAQLVALRTRLETHVLTENVRLYAFLEHLFQGDARRLEELAEYRSATNALLLSVLKFVKHHRRTTFDESRLLSFTDEHRKVGTLLARHAAREEQGLYRLYPLN